MGNGHLPGDGMKLGWDISLWVGVRPGEGKQGQTHLWDSQAGMSACKICLGLDKWARHRYCNGLETVGQAKAQDESHSLTEPHKGMRGQPSQKPSRRAVWQPLPKVTSCANLAISPVH